MPEKVTDVEKLGRFAFLYSKGYNQAIDIASPLLAKAKLKIEELKEQRLNDEESILGLTKSCNEAIKEVLELRKKIEELEKETEELKGIYKEQE